LSNFKLTDKQVHANNLLASDALHCMLYGGSRSGKTLVLLRAVLARALLAPKSRHAVLRFRFNHVKTSVILDTLPKVIDLCFPGLGPVGRLDKTDWFYTLPNGSEIWFGGLDDKERTEKILGQEYATIFFNECSQIPYASREMAMTRLAQNTKLRLKAYYDCNPPGTSHWTYQLFSQKKNPESRQPLRDPENYGVLQMNPMDNKANLRDDYFTILDNMSERKRRRFRDGLFGEAADNAIWTMELLDQQRAEGELPDMVRIVIAVDPSGCEGEEDERSDEVGIVVCGLGSDGKVYVLEDLSGSYGPSGWARVVNSAYERHQADRVVAERNFGGAMVEAVIRAENPNISYRAVTASRGKVVRAEPIGALFEQGKVYLAGRFPALEDQLCGMTLAGYTGIKSPDRADAMVWGLTELFPKVTKKKQQRSGFTPKIKLQNSKMKRYG